MSPIPLEILTSQEKKVLDHLADAWNEFIDLEKYHPDDTPDFRHAIHAAQNIVMARPAAAIASKKRGNNLAEKQR